MATYWENSCSFGLRCVSWYRCLIVSLVFSNLGFWSGNLFLIAPFPDLCLLVPFHKSSKSDLVKRLGVIDISAKSADTVIVDVSQLFYHISWPYGGSPSDLIASIEERLSNYPDSNKIVVFDKYQEISAKDHGRMREEPAKL